MHWYNHFHRAGLHHHTLLLLPMFSFHKLERLFHYKAYYSYLVVHYLLIRHKFQHQKVIHLRIGFHQLHTTHHHHLERQDNSMYTFHPVQGLQNLKASLTNKALCFDYQVHPDRKRTDHFLSHTVSELPADMSCYMYHYRYHFHHHIRHFSLLPHHHIRSQEVLNI